MSSKKKKTDTDSQRNAATKPQPFNQAFKAVATELKARMKAEEDSRKAAEEAERQAKAREAERRRSRNRSLEGMTDDELFAHAMEGVTRLEADDRGHAPPPPPRPMKVVSEEAEALATLNEIVAGTGPFDMSCSEEFIQGHAPHVDERLVCALKDGNYAIQGIVDLHGLTRAEAKTRVESFIAESRRLSRRCVLIVHGKGLNSKDHIPVLKEALRSWMCQGVIGRSVLAFCTARPCDGGSGALYVLLRR